MSSIYFCNGILCGGYLRQYRACVGMSSEWSTDVTASSSQYMTKSSKIPILSPVLFMHVGNPLFHLLVNTLTDTHHVPLLKKISIHFHLKIIPCPMKQHEEGL